ncbi:uncharacterized protein F4822DRAFT_262268 [Hypoxylon trugodes]|uniref:uncharacterized protein n=1 Tax=Hypoxylon trugodes TaxID=326681 RepID=UPI002196DF93|nr:uncharacterized protein F4822DRAFT_262268 [Hypoxylon trugodes]KAI1388917.1 hypothetical protein F4822DRAFT_262268 [Hypoxylon trugodes]
MSMRLGLPLRKHSSICKSLKQCNIRLLFKVLISHYTNNPRIRSRPDHLASADFPIPRNFDNLRSFTTARVLRMASDEDYMAFLDKANRDPNEGYVKSQNSSKQDFKATDDGAQIPTAIQEATEDIFYVSDADEPFVPVYLAWDESGKGLPDEGGLHRCPPLFLTCVVAVLTMIGFIEEFASLIRHPDPSNAQIEIQDPADWDTQGQYKAILDAVRKAGKGNDVRVYRVAKGGVKVEYWVITTEGKGANAKIVGAKALAVES